MRWVTEHAKRIVKEAKSYHGHSQWMDMSPASRRRACMVGVAELLIVQHKQYEGTLTELQAVAAEVTKLVDPAEAE